jgi:alkylated DNA nucleotide flippase Atl1
MIVFEEKVCKVCKDFNEGSVTTYNKTAGTSSVPAAKVIIMKCLRKGTNL